MRTSSLDIRWLQRFSNYRKDLAKLSEAVKTSSNVDCLDESLQDLIK